MPIWEIVKPAKTPTRHRGMRGLVSPENTVRSTADMAARNTTP
jgi:hypothetical protein|tara:strand:+ start:878 stop:1006 length:129 start_codon:yes stop_codon:yes gene_type:complete